MAQSQHRKHWRRGDMRYFMIIIAILAAVKLGWLLYDYTQSQKQLQKELAEHAAFYNSFIDSKKGGGE